MDEEDLNKLNLLLEIHSKLESKVGRDWGDFKMEILEEIENTKKKISSDFKLVKSVRQNPPSAS